MKKILLAFSLLVLQHQVFASCFNGQLIIYFTVQNNTVDDISVNGILIHAGQSGDTIDMSNAYQNVCSQNTGLESVWYEDQKTHEQGTLNLIFNTCTDVTTTATPSSPYHLYPFGYPTVSNVKVSDIRTCIDGQVHPNPAYVARAYFTIDNMTRYTVTWGSIVLNLVKGQNVAAKFAALLAKNKSYSDIVAQYTGSSLSVSFSKAPTTPYTGTSCLV